jgi:hypothetical protein
MNEEIAKDIENLRIYLQKIGMSLKLQDILMLRSLSSLRNAKNIIDNHGVVPYTKEKTDYLRRVLAAEQDHLFCHRIRESWYRNEAELLFEEGEYPTGE